MTTNYQLAPNDRIVVYPVQEPVRNVAPASEKDRKGEIDVLADLDQAAKQRLVERRIDALIKELADLKREIGK